jgi:hypothetical protein
MIASIVNVLLFISKLFTPPKKQQFNSITLKSNTVQAEPEKLLAELSDIDDPIDSLSEVAFITADLSNLASSYSTDSRNMLLFKLEPTYPSLPRIIQYSAVLKALSEKNRRAYKASSGFPLFFKNQLQ